MPKIQEVSKSQEEISSELTNKTIAVTSVQDKPKNVPIETVTHVGNSPEIVKSGDESSSLSSGGDHEEDAPKKLNIQEDEIDTHFEEVELPVDNKSPTPDPKPSSASSSSPEIPSVNNIPSHSSNSVGQSPNTGKVRCVPPSFTGSADMWHNFLKELGQVLESRPH